MRNKKFQLDRKIARLGEHDVRSAYDGMHDDVPIMRSEPHEEYDNRTKIHDIAILHLERAVKFTGAHV